MIVFCFSMIFLCPILVYFYVCGALMIYGFYGPLVCSRWYSSTCHPLVLLALRCMHGIVPSSFYGLDLFFHDDNSCDACGMVSHLNLLLFNLMMFSILPKCELNMIMTLKGMLR